MRLERELDIIKQIARNQHNEIMKLRKGIRAIKLINKRYAA